VGLLGKAVISKYVSLAGETMALSGLCARLATRF